LNPSDSAPPAGVIGVEAGRKDSIAPLIAAIALTVILPRLLVMPVSVIDWDESIYALIAQQWVHGHVPYSTVFDHKPIGLYSLFGLFFAAFGDRIFAIRLMALVFVGGTAWLLARLAARRFGHGPWLAATVAALYGLLTLTNGGFATNTEILVNFFIVLALWLLSRGLESGRLTLWRCIAVGASLGMAFQVNYLGGALVAGVAVFYLCAIRDVRPMHALLGRYLRDGATMLLGFLAVWALLLTPILVAGDIHDYFGLQREYLFGYVHASSLATIGRRVFEAVGLWWPLYALAILFVLMRMPVLSGVLGLRKVTNARVDGEVDGWLVMAAASLAAAAASGYFYQHFFLFSLPALVMLAAAFLGLVLESHATRAFCAVWLLLMAGAAALDSHELFKRGLRATQAALAGRPADPVARIGEYISGRLAPGETIFVYEQQPILYFLTRTTPPSRFAFPDFYAFDYLARRFGTSSAELLDKALDARPRFVVAGPQRARTADLDTAHEFYGRLEREYRLVSAADPGAPAIVWEIARNR
jgi:4-amino-4-deoxy-L-arabinose transferase-like glycosyltransferase